MKIESRHPAINAEQVLKELIKNGTSLVVVKKVGDNLLFGIAKQIKGERK